MSFLPFDPGGFRKLVTPPPGVKAQNLPTWAQRLTVWGLTGLWLLALAAMALGVVPPAADRWTPHVSLRLLILTVALVLTPTVMINQAGPGLRMARALMELVALTAIMILAGAWLLGLDPLGRWLWYGVGILVVIEIGGHLVADFRQHQLAWARQSAMSQSLLNELRAIESYSYGQAAFYIAVPVALLSGALYGALRAIPAEELVALSVQLLYLALAVVLGLFLLVSFARMAQSMFTTGPVLMPTVEDPRRRLGFWRRLLAALRIIVPPREQDKPDPQQRDLDLAYYVSRLRKVYLYDAAHNVVLVAILLALLLPSLGVTLSWPVRLLAALGLAFFCTQLPYAIGQWMLHNEVLARYQGEDHRAVQAALKERAPLVPRLELLIAVGGSGSLGTALWSLLQGFVKETLK